MGFSISWVAFKGLAKTAALQRNGFRDTGVPDEANEAPFCAAELPTGWVVLFSNDFEYGASEHLIGFSAGVTAVSCQVEEHIMFSAACCCTDSREVWSVTHDSQGGIYDITTRGILPAEFGPIKARLIQEQDAGGGKAAGVDYMFDIPVELAAALTGYRHDRLEFDWGQPHFTIVERAG